MDAYLFALQTFNRFIALWPAPIQWLVALLVLIGLLGGLVGLIRRHFLYVLVAIILLPFIVPVAGQLIAGGTHGFGSLAQTLHLTK